MKPTRAFQYLLLLLLLLLLRAVTVYRVLHAQ